MAIVALLTARGNNSLADKNILPVLGQPVLAYPAKAAKAVDGFTHFFVSSDDPKILQVGESCGFSRIVRPDVLGRPDAKHVDVIHHALEVMKNEGISCEILVVILGNNVAIQSEWMAEAIRLLQEDPTLSAVVPVMQDQDHHPYRCKRVGEDGLLTSFMNLEGMTISSNRQELPPAYFLCHNFWALRLDKSLYGAPGEPPWGFLGTCVKPLVVDHTIDIHSEEDLLLSELWLKRHGIV